MTQYEITFRYESGLTESAVEEFVSTMTGVGKEEIEVVEVGDDE